MPSSTQNTFNHKQWVIKHSLNAFLVSSEIDARFRPDHPFGCRNTEDHGPLLIIPSFKSRYPSVSESRRPETSQCIIVKPTKTIFYLKYDTL